MMERFDHHLENTYRGAVREVTPLPGEHPSINLKDAQNGFYISIRGHHYPNQHDPQTYYLHADRKWREDTINERGEFTGYFATEEDARAALEAPDVLKEAA
jgi:hypothetical protein